MSSNGGQMEQGEIFVANMIGARNERVLKIHRRGGAPHLHAIWGQPVTVHASTADVPDTGRSIQDMLVFVRVSGGVRAGYTFTAPAWMLDLTDRQMARLQAHALLKRRGSSEQ